MMPACVCLPAHWVVRNDGPRRLFFAPGFSARMMEAAIRAAVAAAPGASIIFTAPGGKKITILPPVAANQAADGEDACDKAFGAGP